MIPTLTLTDRGSPRRINEKGQRAPGRKDPADAIAQVVHVPARRQKSWAEAKIPGLAIERRDTVMPYRLFQ